MKTNRLIISLCALMALGTCCSFAAKTINGKRIVATKEYKLEGKKQILDHLTKYNAEGDKTEETEYGKTGDVKEKTIYTYNANGKCVEEKHFNEFNKLDKTVKIEYDANGKKAKETTFMPNGKVKSVHVFDYELQ